MLPPVYPLTFWCTSKPLRMKIAVAAAIDVHEHARERRREDGGPILIYVGVEIAHEGVGEAVGEGLERRLAVVVAGDARQGLRAVVGHAHQHRRARPRRRVSDDRE